MAMKVPSEVKQTPKAIVDELKDIAKPATKSGIATNMVGYVLSIPLSYAYDYLYSIVANKFGNNIASDVIKILLPAGVGAVFQFGKLPAGNIVAGVGYGIALLSVIKLIIRKIKGLKTPSAIPKTDTIVVNGTEVEGEWGVE